MDESQLTSFSFCETVTASATTPRHIRRLTDVGRKLGGGADTPALCGRTVSWDLAVPITSERLASTGVTSRCCKKCVEILKTLI